MQLSHPTSLAEVIADGAIVQADISASFAAAMGEITRVEFIHGEDSTGATEQAQVTVHRRGQRPARLPATIVARITGGEWTWVSERGTGFDIPELRDTHPATDALIAAARTLHGNAPLLLVPQPGGEVTAVVIEESFPTAAPRTALITGLAALPEAVDIQRALLGFAAARGLGIRETATGFVFSEGTEVKVENGRVTDIPGGMSLAEVRADAAYFSAEHQLLLEGVFPEHHITIDPAQASAHLKGENSLQVDATIIATIRDGIWRWSWAEDKLRHAPIAAAAANLHRFGMDQGIPEFYRSSLPLSQARAARLHVAAKPVLHRWTHVTAALDPQTTAVLLIDHAQLHLPAAGVAAVEASLAADLSPELDRRRAVHAYARLRGLSLSTTPAGELAIAIDGEQVPTGVDTPRGD